MPVIGIVVSFVGAQVGTAVLGATLGATLGGAIGAGIASGIYAEATGGDFGKGFLSGAIGNFVGSSIGDIFGGSGAPTVDSMLADQMSGFTGVGDITGELGWGDGIGSAGSAGFGTSTIPYTDSGLSDIMQPYTDPALGGSLDTSSAYTPQFDDQMIGVNSGFNLDNLSGQNTSNYFNLDTPQFDEQMIGVSNAPQTQTGLSELGSNNTTNINQPIMAGQSVGTDSSGVSSLGATQSPTPQSNISDTTNVGFMDKMKGMVNSSDKWLSDNLGLPKGSTMMGTIGIASYLQDSYNTYKMEQIAKGLKPMTLEQYQNTYFDPNKYKTAANSMAMAGHTGTLPVLMARMNETATNSYNKDYLPTANNNWWNANAQINQAKSNSLGNLVAPLAMGWTYSNFSKK